jgi:hypothetical protein
MVRTDRSAGGLFLHTDFRYLIIMIKMTVAPRTLGIADEKHLTSLTGS